MSDFNSASFYGDDAQDLRGPPGLKGDKGDQGDIGPRGEEGKDALTVWQEAGNTGTIEEYLQAMRGPQGKSAAYRFGTFAVVGIQALEILMDHDVATACTIGANFAGCIASCTVPPINPWVATISRNDAPIGTLSVDTDGIATFSASPAIQLSRGDTLTLTAPEEPDEEIGRVRVTFVAELPDLPATPNPGVIG